MNLLDYLFFLFAALYGFVIIQLIYGWCKLKIFIKANDNLNTKISVVVAFRNEGGNLEGLIDSFKKQNYPQDLVEYILVDDHSEDNSFNIVSDKIRGFKNFYLYKLPISEKGKKAALKLGITKARSEVIVTTDADCRMGSGWLSSMGSYYDSYKPKLLSGPVMIDPGRKVFSQLQSLEFASLIGSGAGAIGLNRAIMCNAANLLFEKDLYNNCDIGEEFASGDDIFLMLYAKSIDKSAIRFNKSKAAIVKTNPSESLVDFFNQRARWVSKSKAYKDFDILFVAYVVGVANLLICFGFAIAVNKLSFLVLFTLKLLLDYILLNSVTNFLGNRKFLYWILPLSFIYPFYVLLSSFIGLFGNFNWKTRKSG